MRPLKFASSVFFLVLACFSSRCISIPFFFFFAIYPTHSKKSCLGELQRNSPWFTSFSALFNLIRGAGGCRRFFHGQQLYHLNVKEAIGSVCFESTAQSVLIHDRWAFET
ncbi:hypothetical protein BC940DRAFT_306593 [Gongronella butleri]|nr:hypothetical protein BC940DRAFT_306593 [Gongronella butleri]